MSTKVITLRNTTEEFVNFEKALSDERLGECLVDVKDDEIFCDVILVAENGFEFKAHKAILGGITPIFKALFQEYSTNNSRKFHQNNNQLLLETLSSSSPPKRQVETSQTTDEQKNVSQFHLPPNKNSCKRKEKIAKFVFKNLPESVLGTFIDYAYNYQIDINIYNVEVLVCYAEEYHVFGVLKLCCDYLLENMNIYNALGIYGLAKKFKLPCTENLVQKFILARFSDIAENSLEFLQLTEDDLGKLLNDDNLNVRNEEKTFEYLSKWISAAPDSRKDAVTKLIKNIRIGLLSFDYCANQLATNDYYIHAMNSAESTRCYLLDAQTFIKETGEHNPIELGFNQYYARPRIPFEMIFAMGGWTTGSTTNFMEAYDARSDRWFICTSNATTLRPAYHGMIYLNGLIYIIGGYDGTDYFSMVQTFNPETEEWKIVAPMHKPRCYVSVALHGGLIYALGGYNGSQRMACAERYDPKTNQWIMLPKNMHRQRSDACAATIKNKIFIVGGFNGEEITNTAEYYDTETEQWVEIRPMLNPRTGVRCVAHGSQLYVIGGFNGTSRLNTGEYYDTEKEEWVEIPSMLCPRSNFVLIQMEGFLYAIGGFNGNMTISLVESYDCNSKEWNACSSMNIRRSALGACVAYGLSNSKSYSYHGQIGVSEMSAGAAAALINSKENTQQDEIEVD